MSASPDAEAATYLRGVYGDQPDGWIWIGGDADGWRGRIFADVEAAAEYARYLDQRGGKGVYHRGTTLAIAPEKRGTADDSAAIYYFALDVDIRGEGHKDAGLPPDEETAWSIIRAAGLPAPSSVVHSGGGFYPQWRLAEPLNVRDPDTRARVAQIFDRLNRHVIAVAKAKGFRLDNCGGDFARIWRLPGTTNRKTTEHRPCQVVSLPNGQVQYRLADLEAILPAEPLRTAAATSSGRDGRSAPTAQQFMNGRTPWTHEQAKAEVTKALELVAGTPEGAGFNNQLNSSAMRIGHFVPGLLSEAEAIEQLAAACAQVFPTANEQDCSTIASGLRSGMADPFDVMPPIEAQQLPADAPDETDVTKNIAALEPDQNAIRKYARQVAARVAFLPAVALGNWRAFLKGRAGLPIGEFDAIVKEAGKQRKAQEQAARDIRNAVARTEAETAGALIPSPADPMAVARCILATRAKVDNEETLTWWRGDWYTWTGAKWLSEKPSTLRKWIYCYTERCSYDAGPVRGIVPWQPDQASVNNVLDALGTGVIQRYAGHEDERVIACQNGVYDIVTDELLPHTPRRFNLNALPFDFDRDAPCPQWLKFLDEILPNDPSAIALLQEWFGYVVSGRTDQQKILSLVGPTRCGKGTIARILLGLLGSEQYAGPNLAHLGNQFGQQKLIGKSLAVCSDVRWKTFGVADSIPVLLAISGEDSVDVPRKNQEDLTLRLGVRFMLLSNDTANLPDASGALLGRLLTLRLNVSFQGREDLDLEAKLLTELAGILNWALEGLRNLNVSGRFTKPESGEVEREEARLLSAPEKAFLTDCCTEMEGEEVSLPALYQAFMRWCLSTNRQKVPEQNVFSANVRSALAGTAVVVDRKQVEGSRVQRFYGLKLDETKIPKNPLLGGYGGIR